MNTQFPPHTPTPAPFTEDTFDLKKYLYMVLANWYWFVISIVIALGLAWTLNRYIKPVYRVNGTLVIQEGSSAKYAGYESFIPGAQIYRTQFREANEVEVLKSYSLAYSTLSELNFNLSYWGVGRSGFKEVLLYQTSPFIIIPDPEAVNITNCPVYIDFISREEYDVIIDRFKIRQRMWVGEKFRHPSFNFNLRLRNPETFSPQSGYSRYYFVIHSMEGLANSYRSKIGISSNAQSRGSVLFLSMTGNNPWQITDYLNKLMEVYLAKGLEEKNQVAVNTVNFIDEQLGILTDSLQGAELDIQNFRQANRFVSLSQEGNMIYNRLERHSQEKANLELQQRYYQYLKEYVTDRNNMNEAVSPVTVNIMEPLLSGLVSQLNQLLAEKAELMYTVQKGHPQMAITDAKIENAREVLLENINELLKNNAFALKQAESKLKEAEEELDLLPVTERQFIGIQRQYKVNDQIYTFLLEKRAESAIAKASNVSDNKILDRARIENAVMISPKTRRNYTIALGLGIALPLILLIMIDSLNDKVTSRSDVENKTSIPIVSTIGHGTGDSEIPVFENPKSAIAESFRGLRTNLQYLMREDGQKVISVTSTVTGEGKTFCSVNLGTIFALAGKKTLLVGLDLRKPKIHRIFNLSNQEGLSTCLIGKNGLEEVILETRIENLDVIASGPVPPNPAELIESRRMREIMDVLRERYDIIVIDTPPYGMVTDALLVSGFSDVNLFLVRQHFSSKGSLALMDEMARRVELKNVGIVMNDIKNKGYYGYGYRYYDYGYGYGYGYYREYGE